MILGSRHCHVVDCGQPGSLYGSGVLCPDHAPKVPVPDPDATAHGLLHSDRAAWVSSDRYGHAKTDPLGRTGWNAQARLPARPSAAKS